LCRRRHNAHLLRDLEDAEVYPDAAWPPSKDALRKLIHHANTARDNGHDTIGAHLIERPLKAFRHGVLVGLLEVSRIPGPKSTPSSPPRRLLLECLRDRDSDVLPFLTDLRIPPTSNQAERDVCPAKTQQNTSGRFTCEGRTPHRYTIRGVISTAAKHTAMTSSPSSATPSPAGPWMPPLPEPDWTQSNPDPTTPPRASRPPHNARNSRLNAYPRRTPARHSR
jgi:transposase